MVLQLESANLSSFSKAKRAVIYARVSTDEQAESGTSLDNQVNRSLAYVDLLRQQEKAEIEIVGVFREDYSGKMLDRPELNKIRAILRNGQADMLIAYKTNRLDRSEWGVNLLILLQELKMYGIELHYSQNRRQVNLDNPIEALMESISGWQAGEDHRETVTKLAEGRRNRAAIENRVVPLGLSPPFGYRKVQGSDKRYYFEEEKLQSQIVRNIFNWYVFGNGDGQPMSLVAIAKKLSAEGNNPTSGDIYTRRSKKRQYGKWARSTVGQILENETYIGVWHYGKYKTIVGKDGKKKKILRPKEEWIPVEVPPLISPEVWSLVQSRREKLAKKRNYKKTKYLLAGFVRCARCNSPMHSVQTGRTSHRYYRCSARDSKQILTVCNIDAYFRTDWTDEAVWNKLTEIFNDEKQLSLGAELYRDQVNEGLQILRNELDLVQSAAKELENDLQGLFQDFKEARGERHRARIILDIDRSECQLNGLEAQQHKLQAEIESVQLTESDILTLKEYALRIRQDWDTLSNDVESQKLLLERLNFQVKLDKDELGQKVARITIKLTREESVVFVARTT